MVRRARWGCNSRPISRGLATWQMTTACPSGTIRMPERSRGDVARQLANVPAHATAALCTARRYSPQLRQAANLGQGAETAAVVKANAYGLGVEQCAPPSQRKDAATFFVATPAEAEALRALSADATIYVLDGLLSGSAALYDELRVRPVLGSLEEVTEWTAYCRSRVESCRPRSISIPAWRALA